ncbi:MAG: hypothetical protein ABW092_17390 [Candidatus Thiodiazotropha sp.]
MRFIIYLSIQPSRVFAWRYVEISSLTEQAIAFPARRQQSITTRTRGTGLDSRLEN